MSEIVSYAEIDIEGLGPVTCVVTMNVDDGDDGSEVVHGMNRKRRAIGYNQGRQNVTLTIEAKRYNPVEIDWWSWKMLNQTKTIQYEELVNTGEDDEGARWILEDCKVISISKARAANAADDSIELLALYHGPQTSP